MDEHARYADWDAAYLLGSLSHDERREYEDHFSDCARCQGAVTSLAPMPGLLGKISADEALAILEEGGEPLLVQATRRRRLPRAAPWFALAAAVLVLMAILIPVFGGGRTPSSTQITLSQTVPSPLAAKVALSKVSWGTRIEMTCTYAAAYSGADQSYRLYVVDRAGHATLVSSWRAGPGDVVHAAGSSDLSPADIASLEVRGTDGSVLLSGSVTG